MSQETTAVAQRDDLLTPEMVTSAIHVPEKTLAQWRYLGRGPRFLKLEGHVRYRRSDVEAWLAHCARDQTGGTAA